MFLTVLRVIFVLTLAAVAMRFIAGDAQEATGLDFLAHNKELVLLSCLGLALVIIAIDIVIPRKSLGIISGLFFGLVVGMVVAVGMAMVVDLIVEAAAASGLELRVPVIAQAPIHETSIVPDPNNPGQYTQIQNEVLREQQVGHRDHPVVSALKLLIGVVCCYLAISFIIQTKDDVRFVIPYVEFARQSKGASPLVLDTSVIIDGRICDMADTRIFDSELIVPRFVLQELQSIADSGDKLKRNRGRRGLDVLFKLQGNDHVDIRILDVEVNRRESGKSVDELLVEVAGQLDGRVVTNDYNLNKVAKVRGVPVININDIATSLRPVFLPGEPLEVRIIRAGEESGQGVGYLDDGTMVVAESARSCIGKSVLITVTSVLQNSAGRMIFGRYETKPGKDNYASSDRAGNPSEKPQRSRTAERPTDIDDSQEDKA